MNWDKIIELHCNGMVIGSHGMTHTILTQLDEEEMEYEIAASKRKLEEKLDDEVDCFSVPRGFYNKKVIQKLIDAGYKKVFTSNPEDNDGYRFGRIAVRASWDMKYFQRVIERGLPFQAKAWENVKGGVARAIGPGMYDKIRKNILKGSKGKEK
jgi:peptidoglycan/xylan/chitin deacetylase (PgdA/CDA1 family)